MLVSGLDIARSAHQWISLHGENATAKAREMGEAMRKKLDKSPFEKTPGAVADGIGLGRHGKLIR